MGGGGETKEGGGGEEGASCGCYVHCGLYLFDPLLFKHRKKGERGRQKDKIERQEEGERETEGK